MACGPRRSNKSLVSDITDELTHARPLAQLMKQLGGLEPGSASVTVDVQMQLSSETTDVEHAIKSENQGEEAAFKQ